MTLKRQLSRDPRQFAVSYQQEFNLTRGESANQGCLGGPGRLAASACCTAPDSAISLMECYGTGRITMRGMISSGSILPVAAGKQGWARA